LYSKISKSCGKKQYQKTQKGDTFYEGSIVMEATQTTDPTSFEAIRASNPTPKSVLIPAMN
jgi:hypothetical protein